MNAIEASQQAFSHLQPFQPRISGNFEIPRHVGRLITHCDAPGFVHAAQADHMRSDDYVVGLIFRGNAIAYPLWVTDYYHVVNHTVGGDPVTFTTCERCQSGSAFVATVDGRPVKFSAVGMYNASLTLMDRSRLFDQDGSIWLHYEGVCLHGKSRGEFLQQIPTFHLTWAEWLELHPESVVMQVPVNVRHQDARLGHGREEFFSRPGMDPPLIQTITGGLDSQYPENEMVLGINTNGMVKAWPLREVKLSEGVVHDSVGSEPIVVFAGPRPSQVTMAAYHRMAAGQTLSFELRSDHFVDLQTQSTWNIEGVATSGPLARCRLTPLRWQYVRWHAWFYSHRDTQLYVHESPLPEWPRRPSGIDVSEFRPLLEQLAQRASCIVEREVYGLQLPHEAKCGLVVRVGNDRLNLYFFRSAAAAHDYAVLQGAWFCHPISVRLGRKFSRRIGRFVIESDPERQYEGPSQFVRLPDPEIQWSEQVVGDALVDVTDLPDASFSGKNSFCELMAHLRRQGFDVVETALLPHSQMRVGVDGAFAATINADRFAVYKCRDSNAASRVLSECSHALRVGRWVFRSTPAIMFQDTCYEIGQLPDEQIHWSPLIGKDRLAKALRSFLKESEHNVIMLDAHHEDHPCGVCGN